MESSDSIDDPKFQEFLNEPLSNESNTISNEKVKPTEKATPSTSNFWWSNLLPSNANNNLTAPSTNFMASNWLKSQERNELTMVKTTTEPAGVIPVGSNGVATPAPENHGKPVSKEASPGVGTTTSDSIKEFLEKESFFKEESEKEKARKKTAEEDGANSDTLIDDDYPEDFTEISDDLYGANQSEVKAIMQLLAKQLDAIDLPDIPDLDLVEKIEQKNLNASTGSSRERSVEEILEEAEEIERSESRNKDMAKKKEDSDVILLSPRVPSKASSIGNSIVDDKLLEPDLNLKIPVTAASMFDEQSRVSMQTTVTESRIASASQVKLNDPASATMLPSQTKTDTSSKNGNSKVNWEDLLVAEQAKNIKLQGMLERKEKDLNAQLENLKIDHEKEIFELKKQCYHLNAKVQEMERSPSPQKSESKALDQSSAHQVRLLEAEVQQQEQLIVATQKENEKLCQQLKELKVGIFLQYK